MSTVSQHVATHEYFFPAHQLWELQQQLDRWRSASLCCIYLIPPPSRSPPQLMILHKLKSCSPETSYHITSIKPCFSHCIQCWNGVITVQPRSPLHHTVAHKMDFRPSNGILITGWKKICVTQLWYLFWLCQKKPVLWPGETISV